ncbi:MAG: GAF domain-containing protein [Anaerolineales bacterium]|nr:GAF domain-containing protein [Anaerolineales bacterium]
MKILYVEDEIAHVVLAERTLNENLHQEFRLLHAEKVADALKLLDTEPDIDLVLTDLRLPDGTGLELLKKIRERKAPPAVVLVTGQGDQEVAVAALKAGAADYLVKQSDYLHRLPVVISNAIAQNLYLREQEALYKAEFKYQSLVEQIPAAVFLDEANETGTTIYMSPRIEELTGYTPDEWCSDPDIWIKSLHPEDREQILAKNRISDREGSRFLEEYRFIRRDGKTIWVKEDASLIRDKAGAPLYWHGILLDITREKESEAALQRQLKELAVLHAASLAASNALQFDELIEQVTNVIGNTLYPDNLGILLFDAKAGILRPHPSYRGTSQENLSILLPVSRSITGKVALTGKPIRLEDVAKEPLYLEVTAGVHSELCVPILVHGQVIGVINTESKKYSAFSERDERLLITIANTLATAADKLRLFEEARQRATELEALYQASRSLAMSLEPQIIGRNLIQTMDELLGYEFASVHLLEDQGQFLIHLAVSQRVQDLENYISRDKVNRSGKIPLGTGIVGWVGQHGQLIRAGDVTKDSRYVAILKGIKSELAVPLIARGKVIGVLNIESSQPDAYTERDESLLTALANSAAIALENARLYKSELARREQAEILRTATASLSAAMDLHSLYQIILDSVAKLVPYDRASIEIVKQDCREVVAESGFPASGRIGQKYPWDPGQRAEGSVLPANQRNPMAPTDIETQGRFVREGNNASFHSRIEVPMVAGDKVFGLLNLENRRPNFYTEEHAALAQTFANQAGIAIEKAQLYQDALRAAERRAVLHRISQDIVRFNQDPEQIYVAIHEAACKLMTCDVFMIILRDEARNENISVYAVEAGKRFELERVPGVQGLTSLVINNGESLILRNEPEMAQCEVLHFESPQPVQAVVAVPLRKGDEVIGMISAQSYQPYAYELEEQALLEMLATHAATAIENSRLFILEQKRRQEAETLRQAASVISSTLDPDHVVKEILVALKQVIPYDNASVFFLEGNQLRVAMAHGHPHANELTNLTFPADNELFQAIKRTGRPIILQDAQTDPRFINWGNASSRVHGWMAIPLVARSRVIGYIALDSYEPSMYDEAIVETAMAFANQAGAGIENARLYDETQRRLEELEIINHVSTSLRMTQSLNEMFSILLDETLQLVDTPHGSIWLHDHTNDKLVQFFARGAEAKFKHTALSVVTGIVGHTFKTGKIYISPELKSDPLLFEGNRDSATPGLGGVYIPIQSTAGPVGVLTIQLEKGRQIPEEINLLAILAEITGNSIHRAQLYEQSQRQVRRLTSLRDIDSAIASSFDLRLTLNILMDQTLSHLNVDAVSIGLYHQDLQALAYLPALGFNTPSPTRPQVRIGEGLAGRVIVKQQTCLITNLQSAPEAGSEPIIKREGFVTYIGVPLIVKGQIKGVFEIFHRASLSPTPDWMEFLHTLAGQAAIAIDGSQLFENLQRSNQELIQAYDVTLEGWARALELRDRETEGHTRRVTELTLHLARYMGISDTELVNIHRGVLLHDIGKMGVPDHILKKTGKLNKEEWAEMRQHPVYAYNLLSPITFLRGALDIPYCHHEHWDGGGYPRGLQGEQIPLAARIFAVVDNWDALLSDRPYRKAWSRTKVIKYIRENAGTLFDPRIVDIFLTMVEKREKETD